ncbi:anti-anti-sigma factor [Pedobacter yulinensis]|uniref:Anti-anti-sigma factor n=1 Tax=Pedobacter yulinensis TaxID=2126353 RepID=A0A2T3HJM6_9SPHI|nr:anti-anti-sigma factor [Pedobacter yulinensis]PST82642.1 anti-anti-sigma factor [Pedobacter yulinensis]
MKFSVDKHDKYVALTLQEPKFSNEIAAGLKAELYILHSEGFRNIILDLGAVKECSDAQDLSSLLAGDRLCKSSNGIFIVTGVQKELRQIVSISNMYNSVTFVQRLEEATDLIFMEEVEKELRGTDVSE